MEKTTKKESLISQLKAIPNQVKVFILGLFVVVLALASILPNLNSKSLQGNVLNAKTESKVDGYGYGYGSVPLWPLWNCSLVQTNTETKISCPRQWWASYSEELQGAYNYAYQMGLTTQPTIDSADMYGSLTRIAFAKMISSYVLQLGLQTPNTSLECSFSDVSTALDAQYNNWVTTLCQLGLVGNWTQNFRPFDLITRAEFGTMLSRAIWGDANNGGEPYYINHLNALKSAGIINNINPNMTEIRGYVMLMLQRAHENVIANICQTPENVLACSLHLASCPMQCRPAICQIPENILACSLGLDVCPPECIYEWNNWTWNIVLDIELASINNDWSQTNKIWEFTNKAVSKIKNIWNTPFIYHGIQGEISLTVWCYEDNEYNKFLFVTYFDSPFTLNPWQSVKSEIPSYDKRQFIQHPFFQTEWKKDIYCRIFLGWEGVLGAKKMIHKVLPGVPNPQKPNVIITKLYTENPSIYYDWGHIRFSINYSNVWNNYIPLKWVELECSYKNKVIFSDYIASNADYFVWWSMAWWSYLLDLFDQDSSSSEVVCILDPKNEIEESDENDNKYILKLNPIKPDLWDIGDLRDIEKTEIIEPVAEEVVTPVVEETPVVEVTEEISKERADSLLEMVKNIFK